MARRIEIHRRQVAELIRANPGIDKEPGFRRLRLLSVQIPTTSAGVVTSRAIIQFTWGKGDRVGRLHSACL